MPDRSLLLASSRYFGSLILLFFGCAGQRPPEGGPIDTTPPEIVSVYPAPNTTEYTDSRIAFEFSKYVDRRSVEESIFISPFVTVLEFEWSGTEVEVRFQDSLRKQTTYVVTVGTDVVDINNRNRMAHAFSLAFSTGTQIDRGEIRGRVFDEKPSGVMIFGYRLDRIDPDTLNPMTQRPDYITQAGTNGDYSLTHLGVGTYRVMALRDEFRNLLYDPESDAMSTAPADVRLDQQDSLRSDLNFQLTSEDTTAPRLILAFATDAHHVEVKFSEKVDSASLSLEDLTVLDTSQSKPLTVKDFFLHLENPVAVTLVTEEQRNGSLYRVFVRNVRDLAGHVVNPLAASKQFTGAGVPDTLPPALIFASVMDSVSQFPATEKFRFDFSDALERLPERGVVVLQGEDSVVIPVSLRRLTAASFSVAPRQPLGLNSRYTLALRLSSLCDEFGNGWKDSTRTFTFHTIDPDMVSSIEGLLLDADTSHVDRYIVVAQNKVATLRAPIQIKAQRAQPFLIPNLPEGEYRLNAFQDVQNTGIYSSGRPYPFVPAERFAVYPDSIKVRVRWPVEGVVIRMR